MILLSNNLTQHIHSPTHIAGNTLDLVISNTNLTNSHSIKNLFSDHNLVHFHISSPKIILPSITIQFRQFNKIDTHQFISLYTNHYIKTETSNFTSKLELSLSKTIDQLAPTKTKTVILRHNCRWFSNDLSLSKRCLRLLENHWRKDKTVKNHTAFISQRRSYRKLLSETKKAFYHLEIKLASNNPKKLLQFLISYLEQELHVHFPMTHIQHSQPTLTTFFMIKFTSS